MQFAQLSVAVALGIPGIVFVILHYVRSDRGKQASKVFVLGLIAVPVLAMVLSFYAMQLWRVSTTP